MSAFNGTESIAATSAVTDETSASGSSVGGGKVAGKTIKPASKKTTKKASSNASKETLGGPKKTTKKKITSQSLMNLNYSHETVETSKKTMKKVASLRSLTSSPGTETLSLGKLSDLPLKKSNDLPLRNLNAPKETETLSLRKLNDLSLKNLNASKETLSQRKLNASQGALDYHLEEEKTASTDGGSIAPIGSLEKPGTKLSEGATPVIKKQKLSKSLKYDSTTDDTPKSISKAKAKGNGTKTPKSGKKKANRPSQADSLSGDSLASAPSLVSADKGNPAEPGDQESRKTEIEEDDNIATELDGTDPEELLQNKVDIIFTKSTSISSQSDFESNPEDTSKDEYDIQSAVTSRLMRLLEEREESLKVGERRIAQLEGAVEKQLDLHTSLQIMLDNADDDINKMDSEIVKLEDEICALQETNAGYNALQQELVKEKEKGAKRELSITALKEDKSALRETYAGYEELLQELVKEKEKGAERELSIKALKEDASARQETDAGYEALQQELVKEREKGAERELSIKTLKEDASARQETLDHADGDINKMDSKIVKLEGVIRALRETNAGNEELQQELVKEREKVAERELSIKALKEDESGGVGYMEEKLKRQEFEASAVFFENNDLIAELQMELAQSRNIAITRDYKAEVMRNSLEVAQQKNGTLEEVNEELQLAKEHLEGEVIRLRANAKKLADKSDAAQELVALWSETANKWKLRAEADGKHLDVDLYDEALTELKRENGKNLNKGKTWGIGGMFRRVKSLEDEEVEADGNDHDAGSTVPTDDVTED
jgi:hypothetical protein